MSKTIGGKISKGLDAIIAVAGTAKAIVDFTRTGIDAYHIGTEVYDTGAFLGKTAWQVTVDINDVYRKLSKRYGSKMDVAELSMEAIKRVDKAYTREVYKTMGVRAPRIP